MEERFGRLHMECRNGEFKFCRLDKMAGGNYKYRKYNLALLMKWHLVQ